MTAHGLAPIVLLAIWSEVASVVNNAPDPVVGSSCLLQREKPVTKSFTWTYKGFPYGNWSIGYPLCAGNPDTNYKNNEYQSPINIRTASRFDSITDTILSTRVAAGGCAGLASGPTSNTFKATFSPNCTSLTATWKGTTYTMVELHFHSLSENQIDDAHFDGEVHLVHTAKADNKTKYIVIGAFLEMVKYSRNDLDMLFFIQLHNSTPDFTRTRQNQSIQLVQQRRCVLQLSRIFHHTALYA